VEGRITTFGLTVPQAKLLHELEAPLAMNQVAGRLHCDASNVTGIVDRLESRGLVERRVRARDRRVKELVLTAEGRSLRRQLEGVLGAVPGIAALSPHEQLQLRGLLGRAIEGFDQ